MLLLIDEAFDPDKISSVITITWRRRLEPELEPAERLLERNFIEISRSALFTSMFYEEFFHNYSFHVRHMVNKEHITMKEPVSFPQEIALSTCTLTGDGNLRVSGRVVSPRIIRSVTAYAGDEEIGRAMYPVFRPDVGSKYPMCQSDWLGFELRAFDV